MVYITREGKEIIIRLDPGMFDGKLIHVRWTCYDDWYADLLTRKLQDQLQNAIREIRKEEYDRGWKHARQRKLPKETWFSWAFNKIH